MKRRDFLQMGMAASAGALFLRGLKLDPAFADEALSDDQILEPGKPAQIANYCNPDSKDHKKYCEAPPAGGRCETCRFFNVDKKPLATAKSKKHKGEKFSKCQLQAGKKDEYVAEKYVCSTYVKNA